MFGTYARSTTVLGALHDKVVVTNAKIQWGDNSDLYIAILKATNQHEVPPKEKHVKLLLEEIKKDSSKNRAQFILQELQVRLKSEEWLIVLKTLIVIHRLIKEADISFYKQFVQKEETKMGMLRLENFNDKNQKDNYDFSAFVRAYGRYLDIRQEVYRELDYDSADKETATKILDLPVVQKMEAIQLLNNYLLKIISCVPEGRAAKCKVILDGAMIALIKDSLKVYSVIQKSLLTLMDKFFEMDAVNAQKCSLVFRKSVDIHEQLQKYYGRVMKLNMEDQTVSVPNLEKVPVDFLQQMDEYVRSLRKDLKGEARLSVKNKALVRQQSLQESTIKQTGENLQRAATLSAASDLLHINKQKYEKITQQDLRRKPWSKKQRQTSEENKVNLIGFDPIQEPEEHSKTEIQIQSCEKEQAETKNSDNPFLSLIKDDQCKQNQSLKYFHIDPISGSTQKLLESMDEITDINQNLNYSPQLENLKLQSQDNPHDEDVQTDQNISVVQNVQDEIQKVEFFDPLLEAKKNTEKSVIADPLFIPGSQTKFIENQNNNNNINLNMSENPFVNLIDESNNLKDQTFEEQLALDLLGDYDIQIENETTKQASEVQDPLIDLQPSQQFENSNLQNIQIQSYNLQQSNVQFDPFENFEIYQTLCQKNSLLEISNTTNFDPFENVRNSDSANFLQKSKSENLEFDPFQNFQEGNDSKIISEKKQGKKQLTVEIPLNPFTQKPVPIQNFTQNANIEQKSVDNFKISEFFDQKPVPIQNFTQNSNIKQKIVDNFSNFGQSAQKLASTLSYEQNTNNKSKNVDSFGAQFFVTEYQTQISPQTTTSMISPQSQIESPKNANQNIFYGSGQYGISSPRKMKDPLEQLTEDLGYLLKPVESHGMTLNELKQKSTL